MAQQPIPASLAKRLSDSEVKRLESDLKNSILAQELRREIQHRIEMTYVDEEQVNIPESEIYKQIGERRGYRSILKLLPEKKDD